MRKLFLLTVLINLSLFAQNKVDNRKELGLLTFSGQEISNINALIDGGSIIEEEISKKEFLSEIENFDLIHLATHTIIDNENPLNSKFYISSKLENDSQESAVYSSDILSLNLKAQMAVLSSCNTGIGKYIEGEGIMSLARAFKFAGCPSIVMSLWEINDISTAKIMKSFYGNLKESKSKDEALREAKLEYLRNSNSKSAAPVFWAATVPIGNLKPLEFEDNNSYIIFVGLIIILILVRIFYSSIKSKYEAGKS